MKYKILKDPFKTTRWQGGAVTDPRQVFAELFLFAGLCSYRHFIKKLLQHAGSAKTYKGKPPDDVWLYARMIRSTIIAAYALSAIERNPIVAEEDNLLNKKFYCSGYKSASVWTDLPRFLSRKEYRTPYRAFAAFFKYQPLKQWLRSWHRIVKAALSAKPTRLTPDVLTLYCYLAKLTEAAHLIDVRETTHIDGALKGNNNSYPYR
ncbi:hypothetical protein A8C56_22160 [Niabella ginsenosidivorans]|uniref:Uncharacterized protein n=1 Tax=Niabella ginsenosidivorans TaxID=1176587 RepID=A0A1A9I7L7_9BACT|nr:hypothetical protein [Niabella ginsenosidivorans]ANH83325.1 hypothetical protein A8C56_22160 [Niabella ginsenosidivorans]